MKTLPDNYIAKAVSMLEAGGKLVAEYLSEGRSQDAAKVYETFGQLPVEMLARLHDVLKGDDYSKFPIVEHTG